MTITVAAMTTEAFAPMLESLSQILDKAAAHAGGGFDALIDARLAPDMFTLAQQVLLACHNARDGVGRLLGRPPLTPGEAGKTLAELQAQIAATLALLRATPVGAFDGAETCDCSIALPDGRVIAMDGVTFLRAWALPHFYFHVVTAYDILRHLGVPLGKPDYLSQVGAFIRPKPSA